MLSKAILTLATLRAAVGGGVSVVGAMGATVGAGSPGTPSSSPCRLCKGDKYVSNNL